VRIRTGDEWRLSDQSLFGHAEPRLIFWSPSLERASEQFSFLTPEQIQDLRNIAEVSDSSIRGGTELNDAANFLQRAQQYREHGFIVEGQIGRLPYEGRELAAALNIMELGERFGFEYDATLLQNAEKEAKEGTLPVIPEAELSIDSYELRQTARDARKAAGVLDAAFMQQASKKGLRLLQDKFPALYAVVSQIHEHGGIDAFIRERYGEVYLKNWKEYGEPAHLSDVRLTESPATIDEQFRFLARWKNLEERSRNEDPERSVHFPYKAVQFIDRQASVPPLPQEDKDFIDHALVTKVVRERKSNKLDSVLGTYELSVDKAAAERVNERIDALLKINHLKWEDVFERNQANLTTQLRRLGVHPRSPIMMEIDNSPAHTIRLVVTKEPEAILQASTNKPWQSCTHLRGAYGDGLYLDVRNGAAIAYFMKDEKFVGRMLIRAGKKHRPVLPGGQQVGIPLQYYGDLRYREAMGLALEDILTKNMLYPDVRSETLEPYRQTIELHGRREIRAYPDAGTFVRPSNRIRYGAYDRHRRSSTAEGAQHQNLIIE